MQVDVLVTNGGPHPADKWASLAANKISDLIQIDELSDSAAAAQARKAKPRFNVDLADALESQFTAAMNDEAARVNSGAVTARNDPFQVDTYAASAASVVGGVSGQTVFASHFSDSNVQSVVTLILKQILIDAMNIQRSWTFDAKGL